MKITFARKSPGYSYLYDSRTTSASVGAASTVSVISVSTPPSGIVAQWDGKELVVTGGASAMFGEIITGTVYQNVSLSMSISNIGIPDDGSSFNIIRISDSALIYSSATSGGAVEGTGTTVDLVILRGVVGFVDSAWNACLIAFTSGNLDGEFGTITTNVNSGPLLVTLTAPLPNAPGATEFVVLSKASTTYGSRITWLPDPKDRLMFSTTIDAGFAECDADIQMSADDLSFDLSTLNDAKVEVWDDYGEVVWEGIVSSVLVRGDSVSVQCSGFVDTFSNYTYSASWPSSGNPTPIQVILDVISGNQEIRQSLHNVDSDGALEASHSAIAGSYAWDFSDVPVLAREVLDDVLKFGDATTDFNPIFLQVWNSETPYLFIGKSQSSIKAATIDWEVDQSSITIDGIGIAHEMSVIDVKNKIAVVYSDIATGNQGTTAFYYNLDSLFAHGSREIVRSEGSIDSGNAVSSAGIVSSTVSEIMSFSPIKITGYVRQSSSGAMVPVYKIRAGDIMSVPVVLQTLGGIGTTAFGQSKFMVGSTVYNDETGEMSIEPFTNSQKVDVFMAGVI